MNGSFYIQLASVSSRDSQDIASRRRFSSLSFIVQRGERGCQADKIYTALLFFPQQCDLSHRSIEAALGAQAINSYLT